MGGKVSRTRKIESVARGFVAVSRDNGTPCCFSDAAGVVSLLVFPNYTSRYTPQAVHFAEARQTDRTRNIGGSSGSNSRVLVDTRCRYIDKVGVGSRKDKSVGRGRPIST